MKERIAIENLPCIRIENIEHLQKYVDLINKCIDRPLRKEKSFKYEIHHIIPVSFGGVDSVKNLVKLELKEHFLAHLYLANAYAGTQHEKRTRRAIWYMTNGRFEQVKDFDEFDYEKLRSDFIKSISGENNPRYGKSPHENLNEDQIFELKQKISNTFKNMPIEKKEEITRKRLETLKNRSEEEKQKSHEKRVLSHSGENNGFYGKQHTEETKRKIREKQKSISIEERQKINEKTKQTLANKTDEEKLIINNNIREGHMKKLIICLDDKNEFKTLTEVSKFYNIPYKKIKKQYKYGCVEIDSHNFQITKL